MNWLEYISTRERKNFGRQCFFSDRNELLFDLPSNYNQISEYILRNPVDRGTQLNTQMALSVCNTENATFTNRGMQHIEGGWPKDVNINDEEQTLRHRKKIEREENWGKQVLQLTKPTLAAVSQNEAVNIYQDFFTDMNDIELVSDYAAHEVNLYRDPEEQNPRVIRHLSNNTFNDNLILATYGKIEHYPNPADPTQSYIWDLENPNEPAYTLRPSSMATIMEWCPKDASLIAGGLSDGIVAVWDYRAGEEPVACSSLEISHREAVSALCFVHSKSNTEFYTGSIGGAISYWDSRRMDEPVQTLILDTERTDDQKRSQAHGAVILEFEYTIPIRYMVGTDFGQVFLGNRKGLTPIETFVSNFRVMTGPIRALERNPVYVKFFLICGDWCCKIWTEECKDSPLLRTRYERTQINCATWSSGRCSLFFAGREDGTLDFWDILMDQHRPIFAMDMFKSPITALKCDNRGEFLAVGTESGKIHLEKLDEALTYNKARERLNVGNMFERETRRIKILDGRIREINLKLQKERAKERRLEEEEEELMEGELEEEEKTTLDEPTKSLSDISFIEEAEEEQGDVELLEIRTKFFMIITDEEVKRRDVNYTLLTKTPFDYNFDPNEIQESKFMSTISPKIPDDATRLAELTAEIESRRISMAPSKLMRIEKDSSSPLEEIPEISEMEINDEMLGEEEE